MKPARFLRPPPSPRGGTPAAAWALLLTSALGATEVDWDKRPADADYLILADPEGNRFCVIDAG